MDLLNDFLPIFWCNFVKLLGQLCLGRKYRSSLRYDVLDVYDLASCVSVLVQQTCDGLACLGCICDLELAFGIFILRVNDH